MTSIHITTQSIRVAGDRAGVESYYFGIHRTANDQRLLSAGRMIDELERRDGEWRIIHRDVVLEMARVLSLDEEVEFGEQLGRRDRTDPSYRVLV